LGQRLAREAQEAVVMKVFLHDGLGEKQRDALRADLDAQPFVAELTYVSKAEAAALILEKTGEDVLALMDGVNPLLASFDVRFASSYHHADSLQRLKQVLEADISVAEVSYPLSLLQQLSRNLRSLTLAFWGVGLVLTGIALYLIWSTIRMAVYAQRMNIRSMQLIGATQAFIRRPFLWRGLIQGGLAGLLAAASLLAGWSLIQAKIAAWSPQTGDWLSPGLIGILGGIVLFGLALGLSGSYVAVNRYLHRNLDELI